ncbi:MAG: 30S ribosomal protein S17 [Candidatus Kinetoplastibacterium crithidii]|nr:30S ribosomal protein S17 [Candidatus Kinetoplastibacterium crithidii]
MNTRVEEVSKRQRVLIGKVISSKMNKSVVVQVERRVKHQVLGKVVTRSVNYKAHDEENKYKDGDIVEIKECRPISRDKSWMVMSLVTAATLI